MRLGTVGLVSVGLLEHAPLASMTIDASGHITWCNPAAAALLARPQPAIVGSGLVDFVDPDSALALDAELARPRTDRTEGLMTFELVAPFHQRTIVDLHVADLDDGGVLVQLVQSARHTDAGNLTHHRRFRSALLELSELSHQHIDEAEFYDVFIRRAVQVVPGAQAGSILLRTPGTNRYEFVAADGFDLEGLQRHHLQAPEMFGSLEAPVASVNTNLMPDEQLPDDIARWLIEVGRVDEIISNVSAPVFHGGEPIAYVSLDNFDDPDAFDETSVETTTVLGRLIADLIRRRRLEAELRRERESFRHLAHHDGLTGLPNRRHVESKIADLVAESSRTRQPLAVLFVDLDDFKEINDHHGHDTGDRVLIAVADALRLATSDGDILGRWGGDEFVIVSAGIPTRVEARRLAHRVLDRFTGSVALGDDTAADCRLSIGVAWSRDGAEGFEAILRRADNALYDAKTAGKQTVRVDAA